VGRGVQELPELRLARRTSDACSHSDDLHSPLATTGSVSAAIQRYADTFPRLATPAFDRRSLSFFSCRPAKDEATPDNYLGHEGPRSRVQ
jgi:hypothetical protein